MYFFKIPTIEVQNEKYWRSKICLSAAHWDQKNHSHLSGTEKAIQHQNGIWHFTQPCDDSQHSAQHKGTQRRGAAMKIWNYIPFRNTIIPMILSTCGVIAYCCGIYCYRSARPPPCRRRQSTSVRCSRRERRCTRRLRDSERKSSSSTLPSSKIEVTNLTTSIFVLVWITSRWHKPSTYLLYYPLANYPIAGKYPWNSASSFLCCIYFTSASYIPFVLLNEAAEACPDVSNSEQKIQVLFSGLLREC